jgi:hypothetical protein
VTLAPHHGGRAPGLARRPRGLSGEHRRWIVLNALAITAVFNLLINGGSAWLSGAGSTQIPLWAPPIVSGPSTIADTVGTLFLLPFITCLLVTSAVWRDRRRGALTPLRGTRMSALARLPRRTALRGVALGAVCVGALGPALVAILVAAGFAHPSVAEFVLYKAILGVLLGAVVTPAIALCAMTDDPDSP